MISYKNSMNGTTCMAPKVSKAVKMVLNSDDVCSIIETSAKNGVSELQFGELLLKFGATHIPAQSQAPHEEEISEGKLKEEEVKYLAQREQELKNDEMDQMLIENPSRFEELLEQGEFDVDGATRESD